jgi:protein SCO1/2
MSRVFTLVAIAGAVLSAACAAGPNQTDATPDRTGRYAVSGTVLGLPGASTVTIGHDAIKGYMPAMAMDFAVDELPALKVGDRVRAVLVVTTDASRLTEIVVVGSSTQTIAAATASGTTTSVGAALPDITLTNQFDQPVRLDAYRGHVLLITFIYTRCPLPDFCPRLMRNFQELRRTLAPRADVSGKVRFLSVSIDPVFDSPGVLRKYGEAVLGSRAFDRWDLTTGHPAEVARLAGFFGLQYEPTAGQIRHTMMTAIIGTDGRVAKVFPEMTWNLEEAAAIVERETRRRE